MEEIEKSNISIDDANKLMEIFTDAIKEIEDKEIPTEQAHRPSSGKSDFILEIAKLLPDTLNRNQKSTIIKSLYERAFLEERNQTKTISVNNITQYIKNNEDNTTTKSKHSIDSFLYSKK